MRKTATPLTILVVVVLWMVMTILIFQAAKDVPEAYRQLKEVLWETGSLRPSTQKMEESGGGYSGLCPLKAGRDVEGFILELSRDPVVASVYRGMDLDSLRTVTLTEPLVGHVGYRVEDRILISRKKVTIKRGETVIATSTGIVVARGRCCNPIVATLLPTDPVANSLVEEPWDIQQERTETVEISGGDKPTYTTTPGIDYPGEGTGNGGPSDFPFSGFYGGGGFGGGSGGNGGSGPGDGNGHTVVFPPLFPPAAPPSAPTAPLTGLPDAFPLFPTGPGGSQGGEGGPGGPGGGSGPNGGPGPNLLPLTPGGMDTIPTPEPGTLILVSLGLGLLVTHRYFYC